MNDETQIIRAGQSVIIPGGATHQLTAIENVPLHVWFVLSASAPEVFLVDEPGESFSIGGPSSERRPIKDDLGERSTGPVFRNDP